MVRLGSTNYDFPLGGKGGCRGGGLKAHVIGGVGEGGEKMYLDVRQATIIQPWIKSCIIIWKHSSGEG